MINARECCQIDVVTNGREPVELWRCSSVLGLNLFAMLHRHVLPPWYCYPLLLCARSGNIYLHFGSLEPVCEGIQPSTFIVEFDPCNTDPFYRIRIACWGQLLLPTNLQRRFPPYFTTTHTDSSMQDQVPFEHFNGHTAIT